MNNSDNCHKKIRNTERLPRIADLIPAVLDYSSDSCSSFGSSLESLGESSSD